MGHMENSHSKASQSNLSLFCAHMAWTDTKCLLGLYNYQETSAKLNDLHHKQEVTCWDFVIVLEDVHIFIVQKHLVTRV